MEMSMEKKKKSYKKCSGGGIGGMKENIPMQMQQSNGHVINGHGHLNGHASVNGHGGHVVSTTKPPSQCSTRSCTPASTSTVLASSESSTPKSKSCGSNNNQLKSSSGRARSPRPSTTSSSTTNSASLDETDVRLSHHSHDRRSWAATAPRRARSAERFDGLRVNALSNSSAGLERDELLLSRNLQHGSSGRGAAVSASIASANGGTGSAGGAGAAQPFFIPRPSTDSINSLASSLPKGISSPPPPYTPCPTMHHSCALDKQAPPSYKQAIAMTQQELIAKQNAKKVANVMSLQAQHQKHRGTGGGWGGSQSFEAANAAYMAAVRGNGTVPTAVAAPTTGSGTAGMTNGSGGGAATLRSANSVPTFKHYNSYTSNMYGGAVPGGAPAICTCSKCQIEERPNLTSHELGCDDAVYMESQAFLMHEIMTDGMAFCSIM